MRLRTRLRKTVRSLERRVRVGEPRAAPPFKGYPEDRNRIRFVDSLNDTDLRELNALLPWSCFVVDAHGRRFGRMAWAGKRSEPQIIPDRRILLLNDHFALADKHVLEIGCFEGVHTIGLADRAARVTAIDARIENVVKTIVRCALFDKHPTVFTCDVEEKPLDPELLGADVGFHVGVLYHLVDPVQHLLDLGGIIRTGLLLDTHYAREEDATSSYRADGREFRYARYEEGGRADPFSGTGDHAKWLRLKDIVATLHAARFAEVEIVEERQERNGPRALLIARRR